MVEVVFFFFVKLIKVSYDKHEKSWKIQIPKNRKWSCHLPNFVGEHFKQVGRLYYKVISIQESWTLWHVLFFVKRTKIATDSHYPSMTEVKISLNYLLMNFQIHFCLRALQKAQRWHGIRDCGRFRHLHRRLLFTASKHRWARGGAGGGYPLLKKNFMTPLAFKSTPTPSEMAFDPLPQILSFLSWRLFFFRKKILEKKNFAGWRRHQFLS